MWCFFFHTERDCQVRVDYIVADFASDNQQELYRHIGDKLADKDIGLLGVTCCLCSLPFYMYMFVSNLACSDTGWQERKVIIFTKILKQQRCTVKAAKELLC